MKKIIIIIVSVVVALGLFSSVFVFDPFHLNLNLFGDNLTIKKTANVITEVKKISEFTTACFFEQKVIERHKYRYFERKVYYRQNAREDANNVRGTAGSSWRKLRQTAGSAIRDVRESNDTSLRGKLASVGSAAGRIARATGSSALSIASSSASAAKDLVTADEVVIDSTDIGKIVFIVSTKVRAGYDLSKIAEDEIKVSGDTLLLKLPPVEVFDIIANPSDWDIFDRQGDWEDGEIRAIQANAKEEILQDAIEAGLLEKAKSSGKQELIALFKTFGFPEVVLYE